MRTKPAAILKKRKSTIQQIQCLDVECLEQGKRMVFFIDTIETGKSSDNGKSYVCMAYEVKYFFHDILLIWILFFVLSRSFCFLLSVSIPFDSDSFRSATLHFCNLIFHPQAR